MARPSAMSISGCFGCSCPGCKEESVPNAPPLVVWWLLLREGFQKFKNSKKKKKIKKILALPLPPLLLGGDGDDGGAR